MEHLPIQPSQPSKRVTKPRPNAGAKRDCKVCCKVIGKTSASVKCPSCDYECCPKCLKTYLGAVVGGTLKCMSCNSLFTQEFVCAALGASFFKKEYRKLREDALFNSQLTFIPDTMHFITLEEERAQAAAHLCTLREEKRKYNEKLHALEKKCEEQRFLIADLDARMKQPKSTDVKQHVKCLNASCNGAMTHTSDTLLHCAACKSHACPNCREILPDGAAAAQHVCNPEVLASVEAIARTSKPCPTCNVAIFRSEGCSQMFCTQCHTTFDYHTGNIERETFHNPHFFEFLTKDAEAAAAFESGRFEEYLDQRHPRHNAVCRMPDYGLLSRRCVNIAMMKRDHVYFMHSSAEAIKELAHSIDSKIKIAANPELFFRDLRLKYVRKLIDDNDFKRELFSRERSNDYNVAVFQLYDMYTRVVTDLFHKIIGTRDDTVVVEALTEIKELRAYFNKQIHDISKRYACKRNAIVFTADWYMDYLSSRPDVDG